MSNNRINFSKNKTPQYQLNCGSTDSKTCILKFSMCHDKYPLWELGKEELKEFIKLAKNVPLFKYIFFFILFF